MGLLFNGKYCRSVYAQLEHNRKIQDEGEIDLYEEFADDRAWQLDSYDSKESKEAKQESSNSIGDIY